MSRDRIAMVVGVGGGLGAALGRRFAAAGMKLALVARGDAVTQPLAEEIDGTAYRADTTDEAAVNGLFDRVSGDLGEPDLVAFNAGAFQRTSILDATAEDFDRSWRVSCYGGFLVGRAAARGMAARGSGTIVFTSATAALRGGAGFVNLAVGKFGLRALAQSMARELGPKGVHIANIIIDGLINGPSHAAMTDDIAAGKLLDPNAIAETYYQIHIQDRTAWTLELDLRPAVEKF